jgi:hypothetical protein
LLGVIRAAVSPLVDGHPVILTRERLALKHYLEETQSWIQRFDDIAVRLDTLRPTSIATVDNVVTNTSLILVTQIPKGSLPSQVNLPSQTPLSAFATPAHHPANLYDRAQAAEQVIQELQALDRELQQIETPVAFIGLQDIAAETMQAFASWSAQVMDAIGTPTSETIAAAQTARQAVLITLNNLRQALARQQGSQP